MSRRTRSHFRRLDGLLLLDKPIGLSSNQALQRVRHIFKAEKAGHTGSLDPLATGLLPVCFGEATKIAGGLLGARKAYLATARLGVVTDTDDAEGQTIRERDVPELTSEQIDSALRTFIGRIWQRPPIYSALKQGGEPLYAKARRGEIVEVAEREVDVHTFELDPTGGLWDQAAAPVLRLHVECGSGTYIRSLVRDLGELLGCGAHITELRRIWVDPFRNAKMWTLDELSDLQSRSPQNLDGCLLAIEDGMLAWPRVDVTSEQAIKLGFGQSVTCLSQCAGEVAIFTDCGRAIGLGHVDDNAELKPKRMFTWAKSEHTAS